MSSTKTSEKKMNKIEQLLSQKPSTFTPKKTLGTQLSAPINSKTDASKKNWPKKIQQKKTVVEYSPHFSFEVT